MARILFLTQVLPYPLDSGAKIRAYYVLRHLSHRHEVTLVSFVRPDDRPESVAHLQQFCRAVHSVPMRRSLLRDARAGSIGLLTGRPIVIVRDEDRQMQRLLRQLMSAGPFDVVHADQTSMAQYALYARAQASHPTPRLLLDAHNALYRIPQRLASRESNPLRRRLFRREARALLRYELDLLHRFDRVVFVADQDREALQSANLHSAVIPICIDPADKRLIERVPDPGAITHLGTMFWPPNVEGVLWFARNVFPLVLEHLPDARLVVVGKDPPQDVEDLPLKVRNVQVTGYVPDPAPYLAETAAFIVPLHAAGGMRVKIVDAWCWGVPVVSTSIGAEGIALEDGENILIADTAAAFAQAVVRVLEDPALGERLRQNGRRWVEQHYNWRSTYTQWDEVYAQLP
ncbi:MAG: glycosyltransferase [Anaerolineae bacterium]|nr:glycosyltransferase [Anaerolineae bacterium]